MISNIDLYKKNLEELISLGNDLSKAIQYECYPEEFEKHIKPILKNKFADFIKKIPSFKQKYQYWYSESLVLLKQIMPDRVNDFIRYYEKPKNRKSIEYSNYVVEDYLQGLVVKTGLGDIKVGPNAAIAQFEQQLGILKSVERRFVSKLFDIRQLVQADLFDSELEVAKELNKKGFVRGAGAVAGVVLEKHLNQVCINHKVQLNKKNPSISDFNDKLKESEIFETPTWRKIQHLGDLRNLCDHKKKKEPTVEEIDELIDGVDKICKTLF